MRAREIINESMWLYPAKMTIRKDGDEEYKYLDSVFPKEWTDQNLGWRDLGDGDEEEIENPEYRPDLDMNLSNDNMGDLMDSLGFDNDGDSSYNIPIDQFIQAAQRWLKQHLDKPAGGRDSFEHEREISGQNINYDFIRKKLAKEKTEQLLADPEFQREVDALMRMVARPNVDQRWKDMYPDRETAVQVKLKRWVDSHVESEIHQLRLKNEKPVGPRMIQGGREDGYLNKKIMKALKIAQEGKARGAEYISAA